MVKHTKESYKTLVDRNRANAKANAEAHIKRIQENICAAYTVKCITKMGVYSCAEELGIKNCPIIDYSKEET